LKPFVSGSRPVNASAIAFWRAAFAASMELGFAVSGALSAVYAVKVVIVAPVLRWLVSKILKIQPVAQ
jgi:hypothetical protein